MRRLLRLTNSSPRAAGGRRPLRIGRLNFRRRRQLTGRAAVGWSVWFCAFISTAIQPMLGSVAPPAHIHLRQLFGCQQTRFSQSEQHRTDGDWPQTHLVHLLAVTTEHPPAFQTTSSPELRTDRSHLVTERRALLPTQRPPPAPPQLLNHLRKPRTR